MIQKVAWFLPVILAVLWVKPVLAQDVNVDIYFETLIAVDTTLESGFGMERDETYIVVDGNTPGGPVNARLPRTYVFNDDYYEFFSNHDALFGRPLDWSNQDQAIAPPPHLWSGHIPEGQKADFNIYVREQDNADLEGVYQAISEGAIKAEESDDPLVAGAAHAIRSMLNPSDVQGGSEVIGAFHVTVRNTGGNIDVVWVPLPEIRINDETFFNTKLEDDSNYALSLNEQSESAVRFVFSGMHNGESHLYRADLVVKKRVGAPTQATKLQHLMIERCSEDSLVGIWQLFPSGWRKTYSLAWGDLAKIELRWAWDFVLGWTCGKGDNNPTWFASNMTLWNTKTIVVYRGLEPGPGKGHSNRLLQINFYGTEDW